MKVSTNTKIFTVGWPHFKDSWYCYPQESNGRMFGGRKTLGKQRSGWEDAVWRYAINLLQVRDRKAARKREVGGRRSGRPYVPKMGRSTKEDMCHSRTLPKA